MCSKDSKVCLAVRGINKSYGERKILENLSFNIQGGSIVVLMGTNGAGKTTLFNILSGFLKQDSGTVLFKGISIDRLDPYKVARMGMGRSFQDLRLVSRLSVKDNLMLAFTGQSGENWWNTFFPRRKDMEEQRQNSTKAIEILKMCFIDDVADCYADEISYGQQKLLNLACCIAEGSDLLLLDEPVAGVNMSFREKIADVIMLLKQSGKTLLIIEHNSDFIQSVADRIIFLHDGTISTFDSYQLFSNDEFVKNAYV